ncbi:hypothetical protein HMPREF9435_0289 [Gardnerella vaginalis 315-A]|nr:hypothetical protein HMPREF9435_0289 [Gardnerella vaginalis 315-A]
MLRAYRKLSNSGLGFRVVCRKFPFLTMWSLGCCLIVLDACCWLVVSC